MSNSETLTLLSDALTLVERWAAPLAATDTEVTSDGLSISYESDPDVGGWSGVADASSAEFGALLTTLLRTGAVEHLQRTLRTAVTFVEAGHVDDPAVSDGQRTAHEVLRIAGAIVPSHQRPAAPDLLFERFLSGDQPALPDIDLNFAREDRAAVTESLADRFGQPAS